MRPFWGVGFYVARKRSIFAALGSCPVFHERLNVINIEKSALIAAKCDSVRCILRMLEDANLSTDDVKKETLAGLILIACLVERIEGVTAQ
ncbi:hypothetical protein BCT27_12335 [Enterovibrio norvegicus]|nr:hypothetical protein BCT27_12335 [Enterovibrio norvegicus]